MSAREHPAWHHIARVCRDIEAEAAALQCERFEGDPRPGSEAEGWKDEGYRRGLLAAVCDIEEDAQPAHFRVVRHFEASARAAIQRERERMRRWHLRLRWRKQRRDPDIGHDRLLNRAYFTALDEPLPPGSWSYIDGMPICGPVWRLR